MEVLDHTPSGATIRFADALRNEILDGAAASIAQACAGYPGEHPDAALAFSCAGRRLNPGTRVTAEAGLLRERLGDALPRIGFYSNGEFCPLPDSPCRTPPNRTRTAAPSSPCSSERNDPAPAAQHVFFVPWGNKPFEAAPIPS